MIEIQHQPCYCGVPESLFRRGARIRKWEKRHLLWMLVDYLPTIDAIVQASVYAAAFRQWSDVCGLTFARTLDQGEADFLILTRQIDGVGGTLAEHQLPYGDDAQLWGRFDVGDKWGTVTPIPRDKIDLLAVATHEFGHGIGLGHIKNPGNLMNPIYNPAIRRPQASDIAQAVFRYGLPQEKPDPVRPPAGDYPVKVTIEMTSGAKYPILVQTKWKEGET